MRTEYTVPNNCSFLSAGGMHVSVTHWGCNAFKRVERFFCDASSKLYYETNNHKLVLESNCYFLCFVNMNEKNNPKDENIKIMLDHESTEKWLKSRNTETQLTQGL